jgi:transcriptional regulator with XRE-family HTH domain
MNLRQVLAANLRRARHARGFSQEDLAYTADVDRTYVSKLERGASNVGIDIIEKLAKVLEVEPAELLKLPAQRGKRGR